MTVVLFLLGAGAGAVGGWLGCHRRHTTRTDIQHYDNKWTSEDREALKAELAVVVADKGRWRRDATEAWRIARGLTELVIAPERPPIPLAPARPRRPVPTYGNWR